MARYNRLQGKNKEGYATRLPSTTEEQQSSSSGILINPKRLSKQFDIYLEGQIKRKPAVERNSSILDDKLPLIKIKRKLEKQQVRVEHRQSWNYSTLVEPSEEKVEKVKSLFRHFEREAKPLLS